MYISNYMNPNLDDRLNDETSVREKEINKNSKKEKDQKTSNSYYTELQLKNF